MLCFPCTELCLQRRNTHGRYKSAMQNTRSSGVSGEGMLRILENSHSSPMALCGGFPGPLNIWIISSFSLFPRTPGKLIWAGCKSPRETSGVRGITIKEEYENVGWSLGYLPPKTARAYPQKVSLWPDPMAPLTWAARSALLCDAAQSPWTPIITVISGRCCIADPLMFEHPVI